MEIFGKLQNTTPVGNSQLSFKQRFKCCWPNFCSWAAKHFINLQSIHLTSDRFANYVTVSLISHDFVVTDAHRLPCFYLGHPSKIPRVSNSSSRFSSAIYLKAKFLVTMKYIVLKSKESVLICHHCSNQIHKVL